MPQIPHFQGYLRRLSNAAAPMWVVREAQLREEGQGQRAGRSVPQCAMLYV